RAALSKRTERLVLLRGSTMGERPWGASSSIRAMKYSKQTRLNRDQKRGNNSNQFGVLTSLESDEYEKSFSSLSGKATPENVFRKAAMLRLDLLDLVKCQPPDSKSERAILATIQKMETDEKLAKGPPLDLARLANLEARILQLSKIKESVVKDLKAVRVSEEDKKNLVKEEGIIHQSSPMVPQEHEVGIEAKEKSKVSGAETVSEGEPDIDEVDEMGEDTSNVVSGSALFSQGECEAISPEEASTTELNLELSKISEVTLHEKTDRGNKVLFPIAISEGLDEAPVDGLGKKGPAEQETKKALKVEMRVDGVYAGSISAFSCATEDLASKAEGDGSEGDDEVEVNCSVDGSNEFD
ncbi:hypothetical protein U1Q18_032636, partial [Sarracenia purpurea var. burkii]